MPKTKRVRTSVPELAHSYERIDANGETIQHRSTLVNYSEIEAKVFATEADKPGSANKLVEAWKNFTPKIPLSYVLASLRARRRK